MSRMTMRVSAWMAAMLLGLLAATVASAAQLPDFTGIVKQNAPAVVHVEAKYDGQHGQGGSRMVQVPPGQMPDIMRHFFGMPAMPPQDEAHTSLGSGFIISSDGYILTNNHVVADADQVTVRLQDHRVLKAKVVGTDKPYDIALLKVKAKDLPTVTLGDSSTLRPGQWVLAIGSPFGFDYTVTQGIVSAVGRSFGPADQPYVPFIQTDVPINRGNSGGPLFNLDGQVVGINSQIYSSTGGYMGVSFSIPINVAMDAVKQLKTKGYVSRGMIGVELQEVGYNKAKALGMKRAIGAIVNKVEDGKPAARAGVQVGDVITAYNGRTIRSVADLPPMVAATPPGTEATLQVFRDGHYKTLKVKVGEMPHTEEGMMAMRNGGASSSHLLGFTVSGISDEQRQQIGLKKGEGVVISNIVARDAAEAGLRSGDVILMVGQRKIGSVAQFNKAIRGVKPGDTVLLLVRDQQGNTSFRTVTVPSRH